MSTLAEAIADFLAQKRIAVVGVSRSQDQAANAIFRKLRQSGYEVFPVNPRATAVEGATCYPNLESIPGGVDAVVVATPPQAGAQVVRECSELGIARIWLHRSFGQGSVADEAVELGRQEKLTVIPGACPMMFCEPIDFAHRCMRWILKMTGGLPKQL